MGDHQEPAPDRTRALGGYHARQDRQRQAHRARRISEKPSDQRREEGEIGGHDKPLLRAPEDALQLRGPEKTSPRESRERGPAIHGR